MSHEPPGPGRRGFLKQAAVALSALSLPLSACRAEEGGTGDGNRSPDGDAAAVGPMREELAGALLDAVADAVLPTAIGPEGRRESAEAFRRWLEGFEPAAELNHRYGSQAIRYGPEDPGPRWASQLAALELVARRREERGFADLPTARRRELIRRRVPDPGDASGRGLPGNPARAEHVAVGMLAWFYGRPEGADLAYRARIGRHSCRPLEDSGDPPPPLSEDGAAATARDGERADAPGRSDLAARRSPRRPSPGS